MKPLHEMIVNACEQAKPNQYNMDIMNPSLTRMGPCFQRNSQWVSSSWIKPVDIPQYYKDNFQTLGEKYNNYGLIPLAIPRIELPNRETFLEIWNREAIDLTPVGSADKPELRGFHCNSNCVLDFQLHDLYTNGKLMTKSISTEAGYLQGRSAIGAYNKKLYKHKYFFDLITQIHDYYPISIMSNMLLVEIVADVAPRQEQTWPWRCPTEFRTILWDDNTESTNYVARIDTAEVEYLSLPPDTNSYAFSNGNYIWGCEYKGVPQYQLWLNAVWDYKKLDRLIEESINKYAILEKNTDR